MEELTHLVGGGRKKNTFIDIVLNEYEDTSSPAFGKNAATVRNVLLRKYPQYKNQLTPAFVRSTLETHSPAYSTTRVTTQQPKSFRGTSFYSPHPHYRWHVDLQDMTIFKKAGKRSKKGTEYNFMLVCVDDFSNFFMIELIKNKRAATVLNAVIKIIQRVKSVPIFIYCDKGSEFDNKLFTDRSTNGFRVQFTIDRRKAVYAERAIRTLRRGLEQYFAIRPFDNDIKSAVKTIVNGHNHSPSGRNPRRPDGTYSTPFEVITTPSLMDEMEDALRTRRSRQYTTNLRKKIINKLPKFKEGDLVRYLLRREKFSKESALSGSWTREIYRILRVHRAHSFKPMHTYTLCKLNTTVPIPGLPSLPEYQIKKATITPRQTFPVERILKKRKNKVLVKWRDYDVPTWEPRRYVR